MDQTSDLEMMELGRHRGHGRLHPLLKVKQREARPFRGAHFVTVLFIELVRVLRGHCCLVSARKPHRHEEQAAKLEVRSQVYYPPNSPRLGTVLLCLALRHAHAGRVVGRVYWRVFEPRFRGETTPMAAADSTTRLRGHDVHRDGYCGHWVLRSLGPSCDQLERKSATDLG